MPTKIYVVNHGGHDFTKAERFGELIYCTRGSLNKWDINEMFRRAREDLADSGPEDYILLTSLTSLCCVYSAVFAHKHGKLNLLIFRDGGYVARTLVFDKEEVPVG